MADDKFARTVNNHLYKIGATKDATQFMIPEKIEKIRDSFDFLDPYVQAILIQSVVNLESRDFDRIADVYKEIIAAGMKSVHDWVRRKAIEFSTFPEFNLGDQLVDDIDLSKLNDSRQNAIRGLKRTQSRQHDTMHFRLDEPVSAPSGRLPTPRLVDEIHRGPKGNKEHVSLQIKPTTVQHRSEEPVKPKSSKVMSIDEVTQTQRNKGYAPKNHKKAMNYSELAK